MDPVSFVRSLQLEEYPAKKTGGGDIDLSDSKRQGFVDAGSLVSFTSRLQGLQKQDVLDSALLAQLAASKKFDRFNNTVEWYKFYADVMSKVGWVMQEFKFDEYQSSKENFKISDVLVQLLIALAGGDKELIDVVKSTLESLKNSQDGLTLFSSNSTSQKHGNFQILPCTVDKSNQVNVAFACFYFQANQIARDYFFFSYAKQDIQLFKAVQVFTLNEEAYAQVREAVKKKLGDRRKEFVDDLDI